MINAYAPTSQNEDENTEQFMMILEEQWLIVTHNIRSLHEISMPKNGPKTKEEDFKCMGALGKGEM